MVGHGFSSLLDKVGLAEENIIHAVLVVLVKQVI